MLSGSGCFIFKFDSFSLTFFSFVINVEMSQYSTLTLTRLSGESEIYLWASKTTQDLPDRAIRIFVRLILRNDLICNKKSD